MNIDRSVKTIGPEGLFYDQDIYHQYPMSRYAAHTRFSLPCDGNSHGSRLFKSIHAELRPSGYLETLLDFSEAFDARIGLYYPEDTVICCSKHKSCLCRQFHTVPTDAGNERPKSGFGHIYLREYETSLRDPDSPPRGISEALRGYSRTLE
ncbi:hypothetical protein RF11_03608 [Thelohanellus kitauei]|uniref:Uncharacterized protein n=1 Tax=Thelohanellus kitauei TaxID=669202 RepID=A0A0C2JUP3_THEKT|nr:hypothetical protein RF11_03608 [Thelohanellus kitauei]